MEHQQSQHHHSGHKHGDLINTLLECAQACERCMSACLDEDDVQSMAHCIELDRDCAEVCFLGAKLLMRDSEIAHAYLQACEEACRICAEECGKHDHEHCKQCADDCRKCADACHQHHGETQMA
ncbi:MAG TPA: four-helix bundle copper-binding protein [Panacibacter sp.]|nr:four-helix bundle copper-binding protein [Panacibacter sp.]HNP47111.1 four-helix bundle copper-binding protein [Panacibacter sp.]